MILVGPEREIVSTNNVKELHRFAKRLGLKREWFKKLNEDGSRGYYSITSETILLHALALRAEVIELDDPDSREYWAHLMKDETLKGGVISSHTKKLSNLWRKNEIDPLRGISRFIKKTSTRTHKKERK